MPCATGGRDHYRVLTYLKASRVLSPDSRNTTALLLLKRRHVTILIIGSVLLGATLGRFLKVLVLVPACAFVLAAVLVRSANGEHGLLRPLLEFVVLITSLQIGYVFGLALFHSHSRRRMPRRAGELLKAMEKAKAGRPPNNRLQDTTDLSKPKTLAELGISKQQSSDWQRLAAAPERQFEESST